MSGRVLVLGASGFIGRRIVHRLDANGVTVLAASRRAPAIAGLARVTPLALDATDPAALARALEGVTGVVNCIAGSADAIVGSARVLFAAAALAPGAPRVVHFSSLAAYGSLTGQVDETVLPRGDLGDYSAAKLATENLAAAAAAASAASIVVLRPGIVYGPGSDWWSGRIGRLLCARRLGDLGAAGGGACNLVFVEDVAAAAALALDTPGIDGRTFNLGAAAPVPTWNDYFLRYAQALGAVPVRRVTMRRLTVERVAYAPLLKLAELAARLPPLRGFEPPPPIRPWLLDLCRHRIEMAVHAAQQSLGMRWTALDDGLAATAAWFHSRDTQSSRR